MVQVQLTRKKTESIKERQNQKTDQNDQRSSVFSMQQGSTDLSHQILKKRTVEEKRRSDMNSEEGNEGWRDVTPSV